MALDVEVAFLTTQTTFDETNFALTVTDYETQTPLGDPGVWTLTHIQRGVYRLYVPNATTKSIASLVHDTDPLIYADVVLEPSSTLTAQQVWEYADRTLTTIDEGAGAVLFSWTEYEAGHNNDPNHGVPDVTVHVFSNDQAIGAPVAKGVTDESGMVVFYLDPGTYYLFRRKAGRKFTNPATVEVNFGGNTDQAPEGQDEIAFTWTEYETNHDGEPGYEIPDVWVRVFTNLRGVGIPEAYGVTNGSGTITFYLSPGTYHLYRYKSGRVFNNPFTIEVS